MIKGINFVVILLSSLSAIGQTTVDSPYSRFGLGETQFFGNANGFAQGKIFTSFLDSNALNFGNPASYSFLAQNRPVFDLGVSGQFTTISSATESTGSNSFGLRHMALGFRASKRIGGAFGLTPFTAQGYNVGNTAINSIDSTNIRYSYLGTGGVNKVFAGLSYLLVNQKDHKFSIGLNGGFLFGNLSKERRVEYDGFNYLNTLVQSSVRINDFAFDLGWGYRGKLNNKTSISIGGTYTLQTDLTASRNEFAAIYDYSALGELQIMDTLEIINNAEGYVTMPKKIAFGATYQLLTQKENSSDVSFGVLKLSGQYSRTDWSNYKEVFDNDTLNNNLRNSNSFGFGIEYQPLTSILGKKRHYYKLIRYRMGLSTSQSFLELENEGIVNSGISFGLGLPLMNTKSTTSLNLSFELGKRGTTDNNLLEEKYFGVFVGLTLSPGSHNRWFVKREYD